MVKFLSEIRNPKVSELGGKGHSLAVLMNNRFNVPKGFVITSEAFFKFLKDNNLMEKTHKLSSNINENNFQEASQEIKKVILNGKMPEEISTQIKDNLNQLNVQYVSIRSSAVNEDSLKASFAGLHDTFLNVKADLGVVLENVKKCWASLFNERAVIYKLKKEIPLLEGIAVIIQAMTPAKISGIAFTVHPTNDKAMLIELVRGLGDRVVSGEVIPDTVVINRKTLSMIEKKSKGEKIKIRENILTNLAKICLKVENLFNFPQDIEWCISNNRLWLLQSRAITTPLPPVEEKTRIKMILNGLGASPGVVKGRVRVILNPKEVSNMSDGEILVTTMTNPLYVTAIQKAKAIITDVGGMICHAAIVARELGIPCVVGTENATKMLKDNMEVIVNGTEGKIYRSD